MRKTLVASIIALTLGFGAAGSAAQFSGIEKGAKKIGEGAKEVGTATVDTTKKAAGTAATETKKAASKTATETKKAANKTKKAVTGVKCVDGTRHSAKSHCAHHGGVAKK